jgi:FMN phosphatase YigB (HAD superfamily)
MPLTLEQYAQYLDSRGATWPAVPPVDRPRARPGVVALPGIEVVSWSVYGTLLAIGGGELVFEHPQKFIMDLALEKTVQEFKMWGSMSRKPGQPSEYMGQLYAKALAELRMVPSPGEKHPEIRAERVWENILKKLLQKDYKFDAGATLKELHARGLKQALLADGQVFTTVQLQRGLAAQDAGLRLDDVIDADLRALSFEQGARKPSERLFQHLLGRLEARGVAPDQVLHVGSRVSHDVIPARKLGMRTALFAGDRASLEATPDQLKDPASRPDVLVTELGQIVDVVAAS